MARPGGVPSSEPHGIRYKDYIAFLCRIDAEWSLSDHAGHDGRRAYDGRRAGALAGAAEVHRDFRKHCRHYGDAIRQNHRNFVQVQPDASPESLAQYLYEPVPYMCFGGSDTLNLVLFDDFDPIHYLTAEIRKNIDDVCLALCPDVDSLGLKQADGDRLLCNLDELLTAAPPASGAARRGSAGAARQFQKEMPLLSFTKLKLDGLAVLGQGLLFQSLCFRAMAQKIVGTMEALRQAGDQPPWLEPGDLQHVKVVLLDLQGAEEVGLLVLTRNYSVAVALVAAVRTLTFEDAFKADARGELRSLLDCKGLHRSVIRQGGSRAKASQALQPNHLFRWTDTILAVSPAALIGRGHRNCHGMVEAHGNVAIQPGHRLAAMTALGVNGAGGKDPVAQALAKAAGSGFRIGMCDMVVPFVALARQARFPYLGTGELLSLVVEQQRALALAARDSRGRHVVDIATSITVPVLRSELILREVDPRHDSFLGRALKRVEEQICYRAGKSSKPGCHTRGGAVAKLSIPRLKEIPRLTGIPVALRRTIEYLYQDFAAALRDPFLFDTVIDLYDCLATLHAVLTRHLPETRRRELHRPAGELLGPLDKSRVDQIAALVEAIQNAMLHRMCKTYPLSSGRDMAIDFRGGLNQILFSADAPMKCGLGLLRKFSRANPRGQVERGRDTIGVVTRVGFEPGAECVSLAFGVEELAKLAFFKVDVAHILHAASYCDYPHEAFHLIYEDLLSQGDARSPLAEIRDPCLAERMSEIFALLMSHVSVFCCDRQAFLSHHVITFFKSTASAGVNEAETVVRFAEWLVCLFLATVAIPESRHSRRWLHQPVNLPDEATVLKDFDELLTETVPFFKGYQDLSPRGQEQVRNYCLAVLKETYPKVRPYLGEAVKNARRVYGAFLDEALPTKEAAYRAELKTLEDWVQQGLDDGQPLVSRRYPPLRGKRRQLEPLLLVCQLLYAYVARNANVGQRYVHLDRDNRGRATYRLRREGWAEFQLDRGAAAMFCPVPQARRQRLRKQIVILKTLWGLSSDLRARRLDEMINDSSGDAPQ